VGVIAFVVIVVALRLSVDGVQPYGTDAAQYIEHTARLETLVLWERHADLGLWDRIVATDGAFAAGLHLLTLPLAAGLGNSAGVASATGVLWLLLLLAAVGVCGAGLVPEDRPLGAAAAAAGTALIPAIHGSAGRYYYDLPMIALLWCVAAVLLWARDRRPLLAGLVAGLLGAVACLVKWAAIPYGVVLIGALFLGRSPLATPRSHLRRALAVAAALAIPAWFVAQYLGDVTGTSSFGHQAHIMVPAAEGTSIERGDGLLALLPSSLADKTLADLLFHPLRAVVSVFSPLLFAAVAWLGLRGLNRRPLQLLPFALVIAGHVAFVVLTLPVLDDRFLVPAVPAAVLLAVVGWVGLAPERRRRAGLALVGIGALVAVDLHFAPATALTWPVELLAAREGNSPWTRARGLGAASSVELRGWARHDEADPARQALREAVWDVVAACGRGICLAAERNEGAIDRFGDQEWVRFRGLLERRRTGLETFVITTCPTRNDRLPQECVADLAIEPLEADGTPKPPGCVDEGAWELHTTVADPDGGPGVGVWRKRGAPVCPLPGTG